MVNKPLFIPQVFLWLSFVLLDDCVGTQEGLNSVEFQEKLHPEVVSFIQLLVETEKPTLAEFEKFTGECGGEYKL